MIEIISTFTRPDAEIDFFYSVHGNHPLVQEILKEFNQSPGSKGTFIRYQDRHTMEVAMSFESEDQFWNFAKKHQSLLEQRQAMIEEWCSMTGHEYSWKILR